MTLTGAWVKRSVLKQLQAKRHLAGQEHTLTLADGRTFTVIWDRTQQSLEAELIEGTRTQPTDDDIYAITLHLQIIAETTAEWHLMAQQIESKDIKLYASEKLNDAP